MVLRPPKLLDRRTGKTPVHLLDPYKEQIPQRFSPRLQSDILGRCLADGLDSDHWELRRWSQYENAVSMCHDVERKSVLVGTTIYMVAELPDTC
jgi:hypothetical protein